MIGFKKKLIGTVLLFSGLSIALVISTRPSSVASNSSDVHVPAVHPAKIISSAITKTVFSDRSQNNEVNPVPEQQIMITYGTTFKYVNGGGYSCDTGILNELSSCGKSTCHSPVNSSTTTGYVRCTYVSGYRKLNQEFTPRIGITNSEIPPADLNKPNSNYVCNDSHLYKASQPKTATSGFSYTLIKSKTGRSFECGYLQVAPAPVSKFYSNKIEIEITDKSFESNILGLQTNYICNGTMLLKAVPGTNGSGYSYSSVKNEAGKPVTCRYNKK